MKLGSFILEKCAAQSILMFCNIMLAIKEFFKLSHFLLHMTCRKTSKSRDSDNKKQELWKDVWDILCFSKHFLLVFLKQYPKASVKCNGFFYAIATPL